MEQLIKVLWQERMSINPSNTTEVITFNRETVLYIYYTTVRMKIVYMYIFKFKKKT